MKKLSPKPAPIIYFVINEKNMRLLTLDSLKVGDGIPALTIPTLTRYTLALYFGASGGHNPIHVDIDFAKLSGLDEVIVQGMFSTGFLVRLLTNWVPQPALSSRKNRFAATNHFEKNLCTLNCRRTSHRHRPLLLKLW